MKKRIPYLRDVKNLSTWLSRLVSLFVALLPHLYSSTIVFGSIIHKKNSNECRMRIYISFVLSYSPFQGYWILCI